jgi:hypothetical protein
MVTGGPTNATFSPGLASFIISAILTSADNPGLEVNSTTNSNPLTIATVSPMETL